MAGERPASPGAVAPEQSCAGASVDGATPNGDARASTHPKTTNRDPSCEVPSAAPARDHDHSSAPNPAKLQAIRAPLPQTVGARRGRSEERHCNRRLVREDHPAAGSSGTQSSEHPEHPPYPNQREEPSIAVQSNAGWIQEIREDCSSWPQARWQALIPEGTMPLGSLWLCTARP